MFELDSEAGFVIHSGCRLSDKPPTDGIQFKLAMRAGRTSYYQLKKLINDREVEAGFDKKHGRIMVSDRSVRNWRRRQHPGPSRPKDGVLISEFIQAARRDHGAKFSKPTVARWCLWDPHPLFGRKINSGFDVAGHLHISLSDGMRIAELLGDPPKSYLQKRLGDNPGVWIGEEAFRHDSLGTCLTRSKVLDEYGIVIQSVPGLSTLDVIRPCLSGGGQRKGGENWKVLVVSEKEIERVQAEREGTFNKGRWIQPQEIWSLHGKSHYSLKYLVKNGVRYDPATGDRVKITKGWLLWWFRNFAPDIEPVPVPGSIEFVGGGRRAKATPDGRTRSRRRTTYQMYREEDVGPLLFDVARAEPMPASDQQASGLPLAHGFRTEVDSKYDARNCVRVNGQFLRVTKCTWQVLLAMAAARSLGKGASKGVLEKYTENPRVILIQFVKRCPGDGPIVTFPGIKGNGGYVLH